MGLPMSAPSRAAVYQINQIRGHSQAQVTRFQQPTGDPERRSRSAEQLGFSGARDLTFRVVGQEYPKVTLNESIANSPSMMRYMCWQAGNSTLCRFLHIGERSLHVLGLHY